MHAPAPDAATLAGLVARYSPSGQEKEAVEWLVGRMHTLGFDQAYRDEAGNAVGVMGSGPRQIVLLGHIDTFPGEILVRQEGDILHGRGTVDAKGPLACFVDAAARVGSVEGWQFVVIGAVEEERDSEGARFVAPLYQPDYAIIGEPNRWERVALGYKGSAWAAITLRRAEFHSAHAGETACEAAVALWNRLQAFGAAFNAGREKVFDQLLLSLRGLESGGDGFEQWARLRVGARLPLEISPGAWYEQLRNLADGAEVKPVGHPVPAWASSKNTPLVRAFLSSIRAVGGSPGFVYKTGTADCNIVAPIWGCPAVVYGPGDSALDHTPDERISIAEYQRAVVVLTGVLQTLAVPQKA